MTRQGYQDVAPASEEPTMGMDGDTWRIVASMENHGSKEEVTRDDVMFNALGELVRVGE